MHRLYWQFAATGTLIMVAAISGVVGIGLLALALFRYLAALTSEPMAIAATGIAALVLGLLIALLARVPLRCRGRGRRHRGRENAAFDVEAMAERLGHMVSGELTRSVHSHPKEAALAALIGGFAVGASPRLRKVLAELLKD